MNKKPYNYYYGESKFKLFIRRYLIYFVVLGVIVAGVIATMKIYRSAGESESETYGATSKLVSATNQYLAMYEPTTFDALASSDEDVIYINQLVYGFLFRLDETLNIVPDLVSNYTLERNEGRVVISLREDAIFSNNTHVLADDVVYTVKRIKEIGAKSPYFAYADKIESVRSLDDYELEITFKDSGNASLDNLVFPIISESDYTRSPQFSAGSGPYAYGEYDKGKYLRLIPNPFYYGETPELIVEITLVRDRAVIPGLITMDAVTAYLNKDQNAESIAIDKNLKYTALVSGELEYIAFNCTNPLLQDARIRQSIATSIDRETIIAEDYGRAGSISDSLYYPGFLGASKDEGVMFEPKAASDLFSAFGLKDFDEDGVLETPQMNDVQFTLIVNQNYSNRVDAANSIKTDLGAIGVGINVLPLSDDELKIALETGDFGLYLGGISIDKQFNLSDLYGSHNYGKYTGERVIELTRELERLNTPEEQSVLFSELKKELYNEMPYFPICYKTYSFISVSTLETGVSPIYFDPYRNLGKWKWMQKVAE